MGGDLSGVLVRDSLDVTAHQLAAAASFFHAYPRLFGGQTEFSTSDAYRIGIYKLGVPYLATGIVLIVAALVANFYFLARKGVVPGADDSHESDPDNRDCTAKAFLPFSCFLNLAIILCIALAFASCATMRSASANASDVLAEAKTSIAIHLERPGRTLQQYALMAEKVDLGTLASLEQNVYNGVDDILKLFKLRKKNFDSIVSRSVDWYGRLDTIRDEIYSMSTQYVLFTVAAMLSCIIGLLLTFVCDASTPDSRRVKIIAFSFLLIPLAATWTHTAISTWIAVATADFCASTDDYYKAVLVEAEGGTASISKSNIFVLYQLQCPTRTDAFTDLDEMNKFLGSARPDVMGEGFAEAFDAITNKQVSEEQWFVIREWMQDKLMEYQQCDTQVDMAAKLSAYVCGDHGLSGISAVAQLWLCSFGMSLLFTAIVAILSFGHPPSEFCSGRELLYVYGAPQLISAFGDIRTVLERHSTFKKMEDGEGRAWDTSPTSSDLDALEQVAREYNFDDDSTMSTTRPRRNAYTSHPLKDQKAQGSDWSLSHFGGDRDDSSTDSNGFS